MGRKSIRFLGEDYTKTKFEKKWSEIVNNTQCNYFVKFPDCDFIKEVLSNTERWKTLCSREGIKYKIRNKKFQGRAVRGVVMITPNSKNEVWLGKGKIVEELYPRDKPIPEYRQNKKQALIALRQIIEPQIISYRKSVLRQLKRKPLKCPISADFLETASFHIDHKFPFKDLVIEWCREEKIDLENVDVYCRGTKCYLKNTTLAESWFDYHMINADLQALSAKANLQKGSKYYG